MSIDTGGSKMMISRNILRVHSIVIYSFIFAVMMCISHHAYAINDKYNRVARRGTPVVDGNLNDRDWRGADWQEMDVYAGGARPRGFNAKSAVLWDDEFLYTAIEVDDKTHEVPKAVVPGPNTLWKGDSPQQRVDLEYDSMPNSGEDIEWGYALQDGKVLTFAWASANNIEFTDIKIVRDDANDKTYYECAVILYTHSPREKLSDFVKDDKDVKIGYSDMVNANDGGDRLGWLEWSSGIGQGKNADLFGTLTFDHTPQTVNPMGKLAWTWGEIKRVR
jgi:hypothetical protein